MAEPISLKEVSLKIGETQYSIPVSFALVRDVELECGGLIMLLKQFQSSDWSVSQVVHILHIMLSSIDSEIDYEALGDQVVHAGASAFFDAIIRFLALAVIGDYAHNLPDGDHYKTCENLNMQNAA